MKKLIGKILVSTVIVAASLAAVSCQRDIILKPEGPENVLMANAYLMAGDTLHKVYVAFSGYNEIRPVTSAHLECYVNGVKVSESDKLDDGGMLKAILFKADFTARDEVRIKIEAGGQHVESVSVVPDRPQIESVDTASMTVPGNSGNPDKSLMYKIAFHDNPSQRDYYRLMIGFNASCIIDAMDPDKDKYSWGDMHVGQILGKASQYLDIDNRFEPLLSKIRYSSSGSSDSYFANEYNIFTDNRIDGKSYTLRILSKPVDRLYGNISGIAYDPKHMKVRYDRYVTVRLVAISQLTYNYINDYQFDTSDDFGGLFFFNQIIYPGNVEGGLGLISVMMPSDYVLNLKPIYGGDYEG